MIEFNEPEVGRVKVRVVGVGNAGGMIVKRIAQERLSGVECAAINTARKDLESCLEIRSLQIGEKVTRGHGAGMDPQVGRKAAQQDADKIRDFIGVNDVLFLVAGFGKGTGTGTTPVIAELAREMGALTIAFVTHPFVVEGAQRQRVAEQGMKEIEGKVDTYMVLPNQKLLSVAPSPFSVAAGFAYMDEAVLAAIRGIVDVLLRPGRINLDLADLKTMLKNAGKGIFGIGAGKGGERVTEAVRGVREYPFLNEGHLRVARSLLVSISGGPDLGIHEIQDITAEISKMVDGEPKIALGMNLDESLQGELRIMVLAAGVGEPEIKAEEEYRLQAEQDFGGRVPLYRSHVIAAKSVRPALPSLDFPAVADDTETPAYLRKGKGGTLGGRG